MSWKAVIIVPFLALLTLFCRLPKSAASYLDAQSPQQKGVYNTVELLHLMDRDHKGKVSRAE